MMETGNIMVGTETGITMLDGATGNPLWQRTDLKGISDTEYTELTGTPLLLLADNSGAFSRKTKLFAIDTLSGKQSGKPIRCRAIPHRFLPTTRVI